MSLPTISIVRFTVYGAVVATAFAVGVGRWANSQSSRTSGFENRYVHILRDYVVDRDPSPAFIDVRTGTPMRLRLPEGERLEHASVSPWRDAVGAAQVVGLWSRHRGEGATRVTEQYGLARYTFPDGTLLDRFAVTPFPSSVPCWLPGRLARVIYPAGDGRLYRFAFEGGDAREPRPQRVRTTEGTGLPENLAIADVSVAWSDENGVVLIASACVADTQTAQGLPATARLWWLRLDREGSLILGGGVLGPLETGQGTPGTLRFPVLGRDPSGTRWLACAGRRHGAPGWNLHVTEIEVDTNSMTPRLVPATGRIVGSACRNSVPAFSDDGGWVLYASALSLPGDGGMPRVDRVPLATAPDSRDP